MNNRDLKLDVIKGIAIIMVIINHFEWSSIERKNYLFPFTVNMAVPIFMMLSGYLYSVSMKKQNHSLSGSYEWHLLLRRMLRYTIPFLIAFIWIMLDPNVKSIDIQLKGVLEFIRYLINGGWGKGSYYYPVMIQFIFVFPLIFYIIEKTQEKGLLILFVVNGIYEFLAWAYYIPTQSFRVIVLRYVFVIGAGVYAFYGFRLKPWMSVLLTALGAVFICSVFYSGYKTQIINSDWSGTCFLASLWIVPFISRILGMNTSQLVKGFGSNPILKVGGGSRQSVI